MILLFHFFTTAYLKLFSVFKLHAFNLICEFTLFCILVCFLQFSAVLFFIQFVSLCRLFSNFFPNFVSFCLDLGPFHFFFFYSIDIPYDPQLSSYALLWLFCSFSCLIKWFTYFFLLLLGLKLLFNFLLHSFSLQFIFTLICLWFVSSINFSLCISETSNPLLSFPISSIELLLISVPSCLDYFLLAILQLPCFWVLYWCYVLNNIKCFHLCLVTLSYLRQNHYTVMHTLHLFVWYYFSPFAEGLLQSTNQTPFTSRHNHFIQILITKKILTTSRWGFYAILGPHLQYLAK